MKPPYKGLLPARKLLVLSAGIAAGTTLLTGLACAGVGVVLAWQANDTRTLARAFETSLFFLMTAGVSACIGTGLLVAVLQRRLTRPIEALTDQLRAARAAADETVAPTSVPSSDDEFQQLRHEVDGLIEVNGAQALSLRAYKTEFDRCVLERTQELERAVEEARHTTRQAEQASRAKGDFLARMSHEIRTPLNGVLGMAELLQHSRKLERRQRRYATVIHQSGKALLQLINDVLDFSKIEAGKVELQKERFCVREMVEDALEIMAERAQSNGLELICDVPFELDTVVFADCLRLRQVIINLISNAVKFTERGEITVKVRAEPGIESSRFTFEVTDTGIGISAEDCASIFEAFVQAKDPAGRTSRSPGGTGLGLAISKELVELMGGTIGVESAIGSGSRFHFSLDLAVDRAAPRSKPAAVLAQSRILIIEKNEAVRRMLRQHLRSWGAISTELSSAEDAIARLQSAFSGEFDALIIDAHLPRTTPIAVVAAVRRIAAFADVPILMMHTGTDELPAASRALPGPVAWQSKPLRRAHLQEALTSLLRDVGVAQQVEAPAAVPLSESGADSPTRGMQGRRVLLVEDNPVNEEVAREMLVNFGMEVATATGGEDAIRRLAQERFDVVLMDCEMPVLDGYATTERFRRLELGQGRSRTPVVALTANALAGDDQRCYAAGMDHYLCKPFSSEQLRDVLERCVPGAVPVKHGAPPFEQRGDLLSRLTSLYVSSSKEIVAKLSAAAQLGDLPAMRGAAHALKSSSANVGAKQLAKVCGELEWAARSQKARLASFLAEQVMLEHQQTLRSLEA